MYTARSRISIGLAFGTAVGLAIGWLDSTPHWDDTGVTAATVVLAAGGLAYWHARAPWLWALVVGGWVPVIGLARNANMGAFAAVAFAALGAGIGYVAAPARR